MAEIFWTEEATQTLHDLPLRAQERILKRVEQLALFPYLGPKMERRWAKYRQLLCDSYRVIYQVEVDGDRVLIAYIRHVRRKL